MITVENINVDGAGLREKLMQFKDLESMIAAWCFSEVLVLSRLGHTVKASPRLSIYKHTYVPTYLLINVHNVSNVPSHL